MNINQSAKITVYSKGYCPYCKKAKATLKKLGFKFEEIDITFNGAQEKKMRELSMRKTVPQIFINEHHLGGNDDLQAAVKQSRLVELLQ